MKENAEFARKRIKWDVRRSIYCCWKGGLKAGILECLEVMDEERQVSHGVIVSRENGERIRNSWDMRTKILPKYRGGIRSEKPVWECWGRGRAASFGVDLAYEGWLNNPWGLKMKPRLGLISLLLSAFAAASSSADLHRRWFTAILDCDTRMSTVNVELLPLLMLHVKSLMWWSAGEVLLFLVCSEIH